MSESILVPFDGTPQSTRALEYAVSSVPDATLALVHVLDPSELYSYGGMEGGAMTNYAEIQREREERAEKLLDEARAIADDEGHQGEVTTTVLTGRVARSIIERAEAEEVDRIVIGSHGRSGASRVLLGSVAETVLRRSPVPVTVVR